MQIDEIQDVSVKIPMPKELSDRWDRFTYSRGLQQGSAPALPDGSIPFIRSF
ncbi:hypothetical protein FACS189485_02160 [Spirochaetia bacterium]|nr:hypothetical protein FACS189485_02160 [Spirochaetia bacterium]